MGTPHRIQKTPVYKFDQLSDEAKAKVVERRRWEERYHDWWDAVYDDAISMAAIMGIEIGKCRGSSETPAIFFRGFSSQGDGACFEGTYSYKKGASKALKSEAPEFYQEGGKGPWIKQESNAELHEICRALQEVQRRHFYKLEATVTHRGHYMHSSCTDIEVSHCDEFYRDLNGDDEVVAQLLRDFMDWIYSRLEKEDEYLSSEACVLEQLQGDETEYDEDGVEL